MLLLERLGWIIATTLMFIAATLAFRERRVFVSVLIGLVLTAPTFAIFNYGLGLGLPVGLGLRGAVSEGRCLTWKRSQPSAPASSSRSPR